MKFKLKPKILIWIIVILIFELSLLLFLIFSAPFAFLLIIDFFDNEEVLSKKINLQYILISDAICNENGEMVQLTRFFSIDNFINITNITSIVLDIPSSSYIYSYSSNSNEDYKEIGRLACF